MPPLWKPRSRGWYSAVNAVGRAAIDELLPLTPAQSGMLLDLLRGDTRPGTYVGVIAFEIENAGADQIERALLATTLAHPALRAGFIWRDIKTPVQAIHTAPSLPVQHDDWTDADSAAQKTRKAQLIAAERCRRFDLERPPLMAAQIIKLDPARHLVVWTVHHLLADGWSAGVLIGEVLARISGATPPEDAALKRYLGWQKRRDKTVDTVFWNSYLAGVPPVRRLSFGPVPPDTPDAAQTITRVAVPPQLARDAQDYARGLRITYPALLSALFALCLRRYGAGDDVVFGLSSSGRPAQVDGIEHAVGAYVMTHPVRAQIDPLVTTTAYLTDFAAMLQRHSAHAQLPLSDVLSQSDLRSGRNMFEAIFVYEGLPDLAKTNGPSLGALDIVAASDEPLTLAYLPGDAPSLDIYHDPARFDGAGVTAFAQDFLHMLAQAVRQPTVPVAHLAQRGFDGPDAYPAAPKIPDLIAQMAHVTPDATAVISGGVEMSYADLITAADTLAAALVKAGVTAGDIVPVAATRGVQAVIGMVGVMRAGAAYVPLDLDYPQARLDQIIGAVDPKVLVTDTGHKAQFAGHRCVHTDDVPVAAAFDPPAIDDQDLAYVLFTSGSTGQPKGVMITHANLAYSTQARQTIYPGAPAAFLILSSFSADSSVVGLYWALTTGGTLVVSDPGLSQDPKGIGQLIAVTGVDHLLCLPDLYRLILSANAPAALTSLRCVILAGDVLTGDVIAEHGSALPACQIYNEYGPTEATVWCAAYNATAHQGGLVPIGQAPDGTRMIITDPDGAELPNGVTGELVISGPGVFAGYLNDVAKTHAVLRHYGPSGAITAYRTGDLGVCDAKGNIVFLGRIDDQIKIRGHRVEPAEIESVLRQQPEVDQACVVRDAHQSDMLVAAITLARPSETNDLRARVNGQLPAFLHLSAITALDALPQLPNGKIDRTEVAKRATDQRPQARDATTSQPASFVARKLAALWTSILGQDAISLDDDFFDLGGDSLKAMRLSVAAAGTGLHFAPHEVFSSPKLAALCDLIEQRGAQLTGHLDADLMQIIRPQARDGHLVMIHGSTQVCAHLASTLGPGRALAFQYAPYQTAAPLPPDVPAMARDIAERLKTIRPTGPYFIGGYSIGAVVAVELARILAAQGDEVAFVFLVDPSWSTGYLLETNPKRSGFERLKTRTQIAATVALSDLRRLRAGLKLRLAPNDRQAREAHTGNLFRKMLLRHTPQRYDGAVTVLLSRQGRALGEPGSWLVETCPKAGFEPLDYDHLDLQTNRDAIFEWTTRLTQELGRAERGETS